MKTYTEGEMRTIITVYIRDAICSGPWDASHTFSLGYNYRLGYSFKTEGFEELSLNEHYISYDDGFVIGDIKAEGWYTCFSDEDLEPENISYTIEDFIDGSFEYIDYLVDVCRDNGIIEE